MISEELIVAYESLLFVCCQKTPNNALTLPSSIVLNCSGELFVANCMNYLVYFQLWVMVWYGILGIWGGTRKIGSRTAEEGHSGNVASSEIINYILIPTCVSQSDRSIYCTILPSSVAKIVFYIALSKHWPSHFFRSSLNINHFYALWWYLCHLISDSGSLHASKTEEWCWAVGTTKERNHGVRPSHAQAEEILWGCCQ